MKVADVMSKRVEAVSPNTSLRHLWKLIFKKHIHIIPLVSAKNKLLGIICEGDLLKPLYPDYRNFVEDFVSASDFDDMEEHVHDLANLTADTLMNKRVIFTRPNTPVMRALSRMIIRNVRHLPVLSEEGNVVGIISKGDIFDMLFRKHLRLAGFEKNKTMSIFRHITARKKLKI